MDDKGYDVTDRRLVTPEELAWYLRFSARTIRRWTTAGLIPYLGPRERPRYRLRDVEQALVGSPSEA